MLGKAINLILGFFGFKIQKRLNKSVLKDSFIKRYNNCKKLSSKKIEFFLALESILLFIFKNNIDGDVVECGVFKGANAKFICNFLKENNFEHKNIYLYDTFDGMPVASTEDININSKKNYNEYLQSINKNSSQNNFYRYENINNVKENILSTNYDKEKVFFIKGMVEDTIPKTTPNEISLLILDTDYYRSTKHELINLYPLVVSGGIIIIDDYGTWAGVKKAVDEFFIDKSDLKLFIDHKTVVLRKN